MALCVGHFGMHRPRLATLFALLLLVAALLTGYVGTLAHGYLVPAACLLLMAVLVWLGRWRVVVIAIAALALFSEVAMELVIDFGDGLGRHKLDVSAVALLLNIATGGPLMTLLSIPMLASVWWSPRLREWLGGRGAAA
jgi:hypothetical protein